MSPVRVPEPRSPRIRTVRLDELQISDAWFPPNLALPPHVHDDPICAVFLDGSMEVTFASRRFDCTRATVQIHPAGERHSQRYHDRGAHILVIEPSLDAFDVSRPLRETLTRVGHFAHAGIADRARRAIGEIRQPDALSPLALEALALEILAISARWQTACGHSAAPPAWLRRALEIVHDRFRERLGVREIARALDVPPALLARSFRRRYGVSLGTYVRRLRLDWASTRLTEGAASLSEVALEAGFYDQSHFTRAFKAYHGVTPGRYREQRAST